MGVRMLGVLMGTSSYGGGHLSGGVEVTPRTPCIVQIPTVPDLKAFQLDYINKPGKYPGNPFF